MNTGRSSTQLKRCYNRSPFRQSRVLYSFFFYMFVCTNNFHVIYNACQYWHCEFSHIGFHFSLQELVCRTALETQKLELVSELSNLKLKMNSLQKDRLDFDERFRDSEVCRAHAADWNRLCVVYFTVTDGMDVFFYTHPHSARTHALNRHSFMLSPVW